MAMTGNSVRKGVSLQLGLISIPVDVYSTLLTAEEKEAQTNTVCVGTGDHNFEAVRKGKDECKHCKFPEEGHAVLHDPCRTKDTRACPVCDNKDKSTFKKGKPVGTDFVVVTQEELDAVAGLDDTVTKRMVLTMHPAADVEDKSIDAGKSYYLDPALGADGYLTVVDMLERFPQKAFLTEWAPRTKVGWYRLTLHNGALMLRQLVRPEDVKEAPVVTGTLNPAYTPMIDQLVETLTTPFDPADFADTRRKKVIEYLSQQSSVAGAPAADKPALIAQPAVDELMAKMKATLEAAQKAKGETPTVAKPRKAPAKRAPAKKAS